MKKLTKSTLTLLAVIALVASANAATYFSDNYTVTNGGGEVGYQYDNGIRQSGTMAPADYNSDVVYDAAHHALVTNAGPNAGQCNIHPGGFSPLVDLIGSGDCVIEFDVTRFGTEWTGIAFGKPFAGAWFQSTDPGMGLALTADNTYEIKDHDTQVGGVLCTEMNTNVQYNVKIVMGQNGVPASGDTRVAVFVNNIPLVMDYATANYVYRYAGGFTNNYVTIRNWDLTADVNVDNLSVKDAGSEVMSMAWYNDADSGITSAKVYTHAVNFATDATTTVNGVEFIGSGTTFPQSGPNWVYNNASAGLGAYAISLVGETPNVTGSGVDLVTDCLLDAGPGFTSGELTLSGLTPGQEYILSLYGVGLVWSAPDSRSNYFATSDGGTITMIDQSEFGADNGQVLNYNYTAPANGVFSIAAVPAVTNAGGVYCWYAFGNTVVPEPAILVLLGLLGLAFFRSK